MIVVVKKLYFSKDHKRIVNPGAKLEYPDARAKELINDGWCEATDNEKPKSGPGRPKKEF